MSIIYDAKDFLRDDVVSSNEFSREIDWASMERFRNDAAMVWRS